MIKDERFGLPLSLVEALRADPSPQAAMLADLLAGEESGARPTQPRSASNGGRLRSACLGLAAAVGFGAVAHAAAPTLEGRWTMSPGQSRFLEEVTGPAPDAATVTVTRDDGAGLAYQLVESRAGAEVARAAYNVSFKGGRSTSSVQGATLAVTAARDTDDGVVIRAPQIGGLQALIRLRRTGPETAVLEHDVEGAEGSMKIETISLVRSDAAPEETAMRSPARAWKGVETP